MHQLISSVLFGNGCVSGSAKLEPRKGHRGGGKPGWICSCIGVPNTRWFLRIQGRCSSHGLITKAPHAAQTSQHIFSIDAAMLQNIALVNMYMGRAAQRKAHSPDDENEHWQLSSWMIERQDSADCQRFKWQNGSSYNEVLQPDTLQACLSRSWLELQSWLERDGGPSKAKFASLVQ